MQLVTSDFQDQLVRGLSHRMNNILTLFHGYLGLLLDNQKLDTVTHEGLEKIKEGARAASELMDRTNALVRPSSIIWRDIHAGEFLRQLHPTLEGMRGNRTQLVIECPDDVPRIWADFSRVKMAMLELVRNAMDATVAGGIVRIVVEPATMPEHSFNAAPAPGVPGIKFSVIDDGAGIPDASRESIYAPFFTTKRKQSASGLGLSVALGCAQQLGGTLQHFSAPGCTCFELLLPSRTSEPLGAVA
jgi:signal transduction histidine kinase